MINEILLRRKNKITVDDPAVLIDVFGNNITTKYNNQNYVIAIMKNIEGLGYTFSEQLFKKLSCLHENVLKEFYYEIVNKLRDLVGANVEYNPFYPNFPNQVIEMSDCELFLNAIVHYWSEGKLIPAYTKDARFPLFENVDLTVLDYGTEDDLKEIVCNLINSKTSLSKQDTDDMKELIKCMNIKPDELPEKIPFKENMVVIMKVFADNCDTPSRYLKRYLKTATDVLRYITALSNGDVSLTSNTKYKSFSRAERKLLLDVLDSCGNLEEDMVRHLGKWKRIGERLHPGDYLQYINAYNAFAAIRNSHYDILTFDKIFTNLMVEYNACNEKGKRAIIDKIVNLFKERPGVYARDLDQLLRCFENYRIVIINGFKEVAHEVSIPVLLQVMTHFKFRNVKDGKDNSLRVFFPKGNTSKAYAIENTLKDFGDGTCTVICGVCKAAIIEQLKEKASLGKVYLSNTLKGFCVPQSQRSASSGMKFMTRGSRFKIEKDYIRLFISWCNELIDNDETCTDIDLSCTFATDDFKPLDNVYYMRLYNEYCVHSGDYTNAPKPNGAAEFIDIDIQKALKHGARYAIVNVNGYTYTPFDHLDDLYFGWMEREDLNSGEVFEPSTVKNRINLTSNSQGNIPLIFDLKEKELIWTDINYPTDFYLPNNVDTNKNKIVLMLKAMISKHYSDMYDLVEMNIAARGERVIDRNAAEIIFDTDTTKPYEIIHTIVKDPDGNITEEHEEKRIKEDVKIVTPYDIDVFMGDLL